MEVLIISNREKHLLLIVALIINMEDLIRIKFQDKGMESLPNLEKYCGISILHVPKLKDNLKVVPQP